MKNKFSHEELKKLIDEPEEFEKHVDEFTKDDVVFILTTIKNNRINDFLETLINDKDKLEKAKNKKIKLHPNSNEIPLMSSLYKNHDGEYTLETLIEEFHDTTMGDGILVGFEYGKKFIVEDIQNGRFTIDDIKNMSEKEVHEYLNEDREEI